MLYNNLIAMLYNNLVAMLYNNLIAMLYNNLVVMLYNIFMNEQGCGNIIYTMSYSGGKFPTAGRAVSNKLNSCIVQ